MVKTKSRVNYVLYYTIDIISELFNIYIHNVKTMKIKFTNKQIASILNESSEDHIVRAIKLIGGIHADNIASVDIIKGLLKTKGLGSVRLRLKQDYDLDGIPKLKDRIRFHEYWNRFTGTTDGRGFAFEGLIAGLFGGETTSKLNYEDPDNNKKNPTQDVIISTKEGSKHYSLKVVRDASERFSLGSYKKKLSDYFKAIDSDSKETVMEFLTDENNDKELKIEFLNSCYADDIIFLFAYIDVANRAIKYTICPVFGDDGIIDRIVNKGGLMSGKSGPNSIGLSPKNLETWEIKFPKVTEEEVNQFLPNEKGVRNKDKVYSLFSDEIKSYLRPEVLDYIYNNKERLSSELTMLDESVVDLLTKFYELDIEPSKYDDLLVGLTDEDVTKDFLRNLDRKSLKSGNVEDNVIKYIEKYKKSLTDRVSPEPEHEDSYFVDDDEEQEKSKIGRKSFIKELRPLQVELLKLQEHVKKTGKSVVIVFEGRDSAGKGSTIKKFTEYLQPQYYKVVALGIPTPEEKKNWFDRYEREIESGKIIFFDRSWYNRGIVEPVMGYSTMEEYTDFMENVGSFESSLLSKGYDVFKFWLSITQDTQRKRFDMRKNSPLKYWKFSPNDEASIDKWDDYTEYKEKALKQTAEVIPWSVVDTNDKRAGALNSIRTVLNKVDYEGKDDKNLGMIYPEVVTTVDEVHGADTSWSDDEDKITLQDILELTKDIKTINFPTEKLANIVLNWDNNPEEIERISQVEVSSQYPILVMVDEDNKIKWILDGNHRTQKALRSNSKTIPTKLIKPSNLNDKSKKIFGLTEDNSFMRRRVDKVVFRKIVNPKVTITVEKHPNGQIVDIINKYNIRFPFVVGQVLNAGHKTWASVNGYETSIDGFNFKGGPEKKKFGIPVSMLPPELKNL